MIGTNSSSETLSIVAAAMLIGVIGAHLPSGVPAATTGTTAATFAPAGPAVAPATAGPTRTVGAGGGCGPRQIRVFDAALGEYRVRTAKVCWRELI